MAKLKPNDFIPFGSKQELEEFLRKTDSTWKLWSELSPEAQEALLERLDRALQTASTADVNRPAGEPKIKVGDWHIRLRFSYWEAVRTAIDLILISVKVGHGLDVIGGIDSVLNLIDALIHRINHLDANQIQVYNAITDVVQSKWDKTLTISGASPSEILVSFQRRKTLMPPAKLQGILSQLEKEDVIKANEGPNNQKYYHLVF